MNDPTRTDSTEPPIEVARPDRDSVGFGMLLEVIVLVAIVGLGSALEHGFSAWGGTPRWLGSAAVVVAFLAGFTQWLFVLPLAFVLTKRQRPRTAKGLLISAGVVCFLQTACFGAFFLFAVAS